MASWEGAKRPLFSIQDEKHRVVTHWLAERKHRAFGSRLSSHKAVPLLREFPATVYRRAQKLFTNREAMTFIDPKCYLSDHWHL